MCVIIFSKIGLQHIVFSHFCEFVKAKLAFLNLNQGFAWKLIRIIEKTNSPEARSLWTGFSKSLIFFVGDFLFV